MNWIERMYELKGKDPYSQNGEGIYLEYILHCLHSELCAINIYNQHGYWIDIGAGDGFHLSNTKHLFHCGVHGFPFDLEMGDKITLETIPEECYGTNFFLLSIDIDGNDYWIIKRLMELARPPIIIAEFNPAFTDSRTIKYNPDHVWDGTDYYGFSFEAGKKLAEKHGYKVIFQIADMNMIMVREDLIKVSVPEVTFKSNDFFKKSERTDWIFI